MNPRNWKDKPIDEIYAIWEEYKRSESTIYFGDPLMLRNPRPMRLTQAEIAILVDVLLCRLEAKDHIEAGSSK